MPVASPLNYNTVASLLVQSINSGTQFYLPPFYCGVPANVAVQALLPTGNPSAPFSQQTITSATLTLALVTETGYVTICTNASWTTSGGILTGELLIPATGALPVGVLQQECRLIIDMVIDSVPVHIESGCILRIPGFTLPDGIVWQNFVGATGADGANGQGVPTGGTAAQVLSKIDGTDYHTQWITPQVTAASGKTVSFANSIAFVGTDSTTITLPGVTSTLAALAVAQTFTARQFFGATSGNGLINTANAGNCVLWEFDNVGTWGMRFASFGSTFIFQNSDTPGTSPVLAISGPNGIGIFKNNPTEALDVTGNALVSGSINKVTITQPASGSTLTIADGKTLTVNDNVTITGESVFLPPCSIASLPSSPTGNPVGIVTDSFNPLSSLGIGVDMTSQGGGSNVVPVYWDNTVWRSF